MPDRLLRRTQDARIKDLQRGDAGSQTTICAAASRRSPGDAADDLERQTEPFGAACLRKTDAVDSRLLTLCEAAASRLMRVAAQVRLLVAGGTRCSQPPQLVAQFNDACESRRDAELLSEQHTFLRTIINTKKITKPTPTYMR
jgi:hypothetical protein